jgi:hypothetical protein
VSFIAPAVEVAYAAHETVGGMTDAATKVYGGPISNRAGTYFWQGIERSKPHLRHLKLSSNPVLGALAREDRVSRSTQQRGH